MAVGEVFFVVALLFSWKELVVGTFTAGVFTLCEPCVRVTGGSTLGWCCICPVPGGCDDPLWFCVVFLMIKERTFCFGDGR